MYAPWVIYVNKVKEIFGKDEAVKISFVDEDDGEPILTLRVEGDSKADAIAKLLPSTVEFGNVILKINVIPANYSNDRMDVLKRAFEGNPVVKEFISTDVYGNPMQYVVFNKEVVQYKSDDISDANGVTSTLYQDIAKEIFSEKDGVYYCTATRNF